MGDDMYANAWRRELGPFIRPKRHLIDALVMGTRDVVSEVTKARAYRAGLDRWRKDALAARALGVPEPSLIDYLPAESEDNG